MSLRIKSFLLLCAGMSILNLSGCGNSPSTTTTTSVVHNEWTWVGGSNLANQAGAYGVIGTATSGNFPGARENAVVSKDSSGNVWLFGGAGIGSTVNPLVSVPVLNDLWKYSGGQWTWESGSNTGLQPGSYGTQGTASSWTDNTGNFWLFGGMGFDSTSTYYSLNDLWKFSDGQWTWVSGSNVGGQPGSYGQQGVAAVSNIPGARQGGVSWTDKSGNLWLFGGTTLNAVQLNDLWMFSGGQWTWVSGTVTGSHSGIYGTLGVAAAGNIPGGRSEAMSWTDTNGNLWVFGGRGCDSTANTLCDNLLNDLWKYSAGQWTWESGSNVNSQSGSYGTKGTTSSNNVPGARTGATTWTDTAGNLWLFGGSGADSTVATSDLNDLWKYSGGQWTWVGGADVVGQQGSFGTMGVAASSNLPGAGSGAVGWTDSSGNLWLFGGYTADSPAGVGAFNTLWEYQP